MKFLFPLLTAETIAETTEAAQTTQSSLTSMAETLDIVMLALLAFCGIYSIYTCIRLRRECMLFPNKILYPGNCRPEDCIDVDGFMDFILPRLLITGLLMLACAVAYGVCAIALKMDNVVLDVASMVVPVGILVLYAVIQRKAYKLYW